MQAGDNSNRHVRYWQQHQGPGRPLGLSFFPVPWAGSGPLTVRPHRRQPTRLPHRWDSPGKNTGVGCHCLLQCMKVESESEVAQSCPTLSDPMDCSLPGSSIHGIFQARVLEWGAIALSPNGRGGWTPLRPLRGLQETRKGWPSLSLSCSQPAD